MYPSANNLVYEYQFSAWTGTLVSVGNPVEFAYTWSVEICTNFLLFSLHQSVNLDTAL